MRLLSRIASLLVLFLAATSVAQAAENELGWTIESAIKQLDRQASDFDSLYAQLDVEWSTPPGEGDNLTSGRIFVNEDGDFRIETDAQTVLRQSGDLYYYNPLTAQVRSYRLSQHEGRLEPFIALGLSTTGKDLEDGYLITYIGEELSNGRRLLGLEMTPKRDRERELISKIELWVDEASWMPERQVIMEAAGGRTLTTRYTSMARNLALNPDLFRDKWPKGTKKQRM